jgi:hypothetical protein
MKKKKSTADAHLVQRFLSKVTKGPDCWQWSGGRDRHGYGVIWWDGKPFKAHRLAYLLANSNLPTRLWVTHTCGNRGCVNPQHLAAVPAKSIRSRKRAVPPKSPTTRLSLADVAQIRRSKAQGIRARELAARYGISERHVYHIVSGERWNFEMPGDI